MAITYIGTASNNTNNVSSMSVDVSSIDIQNNDLILFFGSCDGDGYAFPTGFTSIQDTNTGGSHNNKLGYRIASGEGSSYTVDTITTGERGIGIFAVYRGVDPTDPIDQSTTNIGNGTTASLNSLTPTLDNSVVIGCVGTEDGNNGNPMAGSWPGSLTERNDNVGGPSGTGAASSAGALADHIQTTSTAVSGNITLTGSGGSTNWGAMSVSLNEYTASNYPPTVSLNTPDDGSTYLNSIPTLNFTGLDAESDALEYNVQIDTVDTFDSQTGSPVESAFSSTDGGFSTGPYSSGVAATYTVQSILAPGDYYWRVSAIDPSGSNIYGAWSAIYTFSVTKDKVYYVQRGVANLGTSTSHSVTLSLPVNTSKTWIKIWLGLGSSSSPDEIFIEAYFPTLGTAVTTFNLDRYTGASGILVYWQVITMPNTLVQHFNNIGFGASDATISQTITTISGLDKAFAFASGRVNTSSGSSAHEGLFSTDITSTTNVDITRGNASLAAVSSVQIVEFLDDTTVEHESVSVAGTLTDTTLSTSVDPSVAFTIFTYSASGASLNTNPIVELTTSTNIQIRRGAASNTTIVEAYVVNMVGVTKELATGDNITSTISSVATTIVTNTTAAFTVFSLTNSGQGTTWANELAAATITSTTSDTIYKNNTSNTTAWSLQTIQLPVIYAGVKTWDNSLWNRKPLKVWNGSAWQERSLVKVWNGSKWVIKG